MEENSEKRYKQVNLSAFFNFLKSPISTFKYLKTFSLHSYREKIFFRYPVSFLHLRYYFLIFLILILIVLSLSINLQDYNSLVRFNHKAIFIFFELFVLLILLFFLLPKEKRKNHINDFFAFAAIFSAILAMLFTNALTTKQFEDLKKTENEEILDTYIATNNFNCLVAGGLFNVVTSTQADPFEYSHARFLVDPYFTPELMRLMYAEKNLNETTSTAQIIADMQGVNSLINDSREASFDAHSNLELASLLLNYNQLQADEAYMRIKLNLGNFKNDTSIGVSVKIFNYSQAIKNSFVCDNLPQTQ